MWDNGGLDIYGHSLESWEDAILAALERIEAAEEDI